MLEHWYWPTIASGVVAVLTAACSALARVNGAHTGWAVALRRQMLAVPAVQLGTAGIVTLVLRLPSAAVVPVASCWAPRLRPVVLFICARFTQADRFGPRPWAV